MTYQRKLSAAHTTGVCRTCGSSFRREHQAFHYCSPPCRAIAYKGQCKSWRGRNREYLAKTVKAYAVANEDRVRSNHYRKRYGLTLADLESMLAAQESKCALCKTAIKLRGVKGRDLAVVDHCHATRKVRSLLCTPCNLMLGYSRDRIEVLRRAADYLLDHSMVAVAA